MSNDTAATATTSRREALLQSMAAEGGGLIVLLGHDDEPYNFATNPYPFRQDSSFLYYFGLAQPGLAALLDTDSGEMLLVANPQDDDDTLWMTRPSPQALADRCGVRHSIDAQALRDRLSAAQSQGRRVHHLPPIRSAQRMRMAALLQADAASLQASRALIGCVARQREVKSADELAEMTSALAVAARMHKAARERATAGVREAEVVNAMAEQVAQAGMRMAYAPICTRDGHILHHLTHDNVLARGDLLLIDAGAEAPSGYASDITRTFAIDEAWSDEQQLMRRAALTAQRVCAAQAKPGVPMADLHRLAARHLVQELAPLKLFRGSTDAVVETAAYSLVFPHGLGHLIGLDVHDMESFGEDLIGYDDTFQRDTRFGPKHLRLGKPLREGMTITLEPGVYFIPALWQRWQAEGRHRDLIDAEVAQRLMSLGGLRIEDNFVIEAGGARRLGPEIAL